jgi:hypothetical protein
LTPIVRSSGLSWINGRLGDGENPSIKRIFKRFDECSLFLIPNSLFQDETLSIVHTFFPLSTQFMQISTLPDSYSNENFRNSLPLPAFQFLLISLCVASVETVSFLNLSRFAICLCVPHGFRTSMDFWYFPEDQLNWFCDSPTSHSPWMFSPSDSVNNRDAAYPGRQVSWKGDKVEKLTNRLRERWLVSRRLSLKSKKKNEIVLRWGICDRVRWRVSVR